MQISTNVRRIALFVLSMVFSMGIIIAQEKTITGTVSAEGEGPLPGVNVTVQGATIGTITDANGCVGTDEVKICAIDVRCGKNLDKVEICHKTPSISNNKSQTLCVAIPAVAAHLAHGDQLAACGTDHNCYDYKSTIADSGMESSYPSEMNLDAYPNPFTNSATVEFKLTNS